MNGNIYDVKKRDDGTIVILTTLGFKDIMCALLARVAVRAISEYDERLYESWQISDKLLEEAMCYCIGVETKKWLQSDEAKQVRGITFYLVEDKGHYSVTAATNIMPIDSGMFAWLMDEFQRPEVIEKLGRKITEFTGVTYSISDEGEYVTVCAGDKPEDIYHRWSNARVSRR